MNAYFQSKLKIAGIVTIIAAAVLFTGLQHPRVTLAGPADNVHGWLWSDAPDGSDELKFPANHYGGRGLGWISLNSDDPDNANGGAPVSPNIPYGLLFNAQTGTFSGQAWSEHGGWLVFDPSGPYPSGPGTEDGGAHVDLTCLSQATFSCPIKGWAKFVAGGSAQSGGWDGWVSLDGKNYGLKIAGDQGGATADITGEAWGDSVSGWIIAIKATVDMTASLDMLICSTPTNLAVHPTFYTYPVGGPIPPQCTVLYCSGVGAYVGKTFNYAIGDPMPGECGGTGAFQLTHACTKSTAVNYTPPRPGIISDDSLCNFDFCINSTLPAPNPTLGIQTHVPIQLGGVWYGLATGLCVPSVCPNLPDTFYATPPSGYAIVGGICVKQGPGTPCDPTVQTCPVIKPIYKEN